MECFFSCSQEDLRIFACHAIGTIITDTACQPRPVLAQKRAGLPATDPTMSLHVSDSLVQQQCWTCVASQKKKNNLGMRV